MADVNINELAMGRLVALTAGSPSPPRWAPSRYRGPFYLVFPREFFGFNLADVLHR